MSLHMSLSDVTATPLLAWLFNPYVVGIFSLALVAAGSAMVLRDVLRNRRKLSTHFKPVAAVPSASLQPDSGAVREPPSRGSAARAVPPPPVVSARPPGSPAFQQLADVIADVRAELAAGDVGDAVARDPSMVAIWNTLSGRLDQVVGDAQAVLASVRLTVSPAGEPRWGLANRSFGTYRRINLDGTSIGWLRSEITAEGMLQFRLRAHQPSLALLNAEGAAGLNRLTGSDLTRALTAALIPVVRYAAWTETRSSTAGSSDEPLPGLIDEAVGIANGALVEARASLKRHVPPETAAAGALQDVLLDVFVDGRQVALMRVHEKDAGLEVSVGVPDPTRLDLTRRHMLAPGRLAAYDVAEAMATCAWPALAHALASTAAPGGQTSTAM